MLLRSMLAAFSLTMPNALGLSSTQPLKTKANSQQLDYLYSITAYLPGLDLAAGVLPGSTDT